MLIDFPLGFPKAVPPVENVGILYKMVTEYTAPSVLRVPPSRASWKPSAMTKLVPILLLALLSSQAAASPFTFPLLAKSLRFIGGKFQTTGDLVGAAGTEKSDLICCL